MDEFGKAFTNVQLIVSKATTDTLTTAQGTALSTLDTLNNNNIASTTATTLNKRCRHPGCCAGLQCDSIA